MSILSALSNIANPSKSLKSKSITSSSNMNSSQGGNKNSCWYVIIGGPTYYINDKANPHETYFGYPPSMSNAVVVVFLNYKFFKNTLYIFCLRAFYIYLK